MAPKISIVTRTLDRPHMLRRALEDIRAQSFQDWELIVINDGGALEIVDALVQEVFGEDERVRIVHNTSPAGRWPAANAGIESATAPLVVLHDDDDTWAPEFLETAADHLARHPEQAGVTVRTEIIWERVEGTELTELGRSPFEPEMGDALLYDLMKYNRWVPISFLYRKAVHDELGRFREDLAVVGDWDFHTRLLRQYSVGFLGERPLAFWHQRPDAVGADGNSVIAESGNHRRYDRLLRNEYLRDWTRENGIALPLFIAQHFREQDQRIDALERRLVELTDKVDAALGLGERTIGAVEDVQQRLIAQGFKQRVRRMFGREAHD